MVHIVTPDGIEDEFSIGRGEDADLIIYDITSSDVHAFLRFENDMWLLEDNASMYGTSVLMRVSMPIDANIEKTVQVGRSIINIAL